jgi:hypothetical protein
MRSRFLHDLGAGSDELGVQVCNLPLVEIVGAGHTHFGLQFLY